jgi:hypothetical protein
MPGRIERGDSLAELLFAITIFGIAGFALLQGLFTLAVGAGSGKKLSTAQTVLATAAESVSAAPFVNCPTPPIYYPVAPLPASGYTPPSGWAGTVSITAIKYWNGLSFVPACPTSAEFTSSQYDILLLQKITVTAAPAGLPARSIEILKRGTS